MNHMDYIEAGLKVFGLHPIIKGQCGCGDPECKAAGKHPIASNWQHTPDWSDEQLEVMDQMGQFKTGFGVLVDGLLVVDVDARNGGVESFERLCKDTGIDLLGESGFAVATGSGNGSMHLYFNDSGNALMQHNNKYPGIDFKSSGYVVGAGSLHVSGNEYEPIHGSPEDITAAPDDLIELLKKPDTYRAKTSLGTLDVTVRQASEILNHIPPDIDYDTWIRCGMALHETFNGDGIDVWDNWSRSGDKYPGFEKIQRHWHSFGKTSNPVQLGTIIHFAEHYGYQQPVTFEYNDPINVPAGAPVIDLLRPPGLVGDIAAWINRTSRYKREHLAVAAALQAVSNIAGLRYIDERDGMTANMISICIAGSSTGKEHIQQRFLDCLHAAGMVDAVHGAIKSEQEIVRNLTRHQAAFYSIDELGLTLKKIMQAKNASYLEGVIALVMSAYSKADSFLPVSGDVKESLKAELRRELSACQNAIEENEDSDGRIAKRLEQVERALSMASSGIESPFLSLIGYTTPVTFNSLMDFESATNGFLSRALIFDEHETNPKYNKDYQREPLPDHLAAQLSQLFARGEFNMFADSRVEYYGEKHPIKTTADASARLDDIINEFWIMAEDAKDHGLEAIPRRGYEMTAKISFILAIAEGVRTIEHVEYAYALVSDDIQRKMRLALSNMEQPVDSIAIKIQDIITRSGEPMKEGVIVNRCRPHPKDDVLKVIDSLVLQKMIAVEESKHAKNGRITRFYRIE